MPSSKYAEIDDGLAAGQKATALLKRMNKDMRIELCTFMALLAECSTHLDRLGLDATNSTRFLKAQIDEAIAGSGPVRMTAVQKAKQGCGNPHHYASD